MPRTTSFSSIIMPKDGLLLCQAIKQELSKAGIPRPYNGMNGAEISGLINPGHYGSTGFSVAHRMGGKWDSLKEEHFEFNVVVSGDKTPQVRFRYYEEWSNDECMDMHEPVNQDILHPAIRKVFTDMGLTVINIQSSGCQRHWDYDMEYSIRCKPVLPAIMPTIDEDPS